MSASKRVRPVTSCIATSGILEPTGQLTLSRPIRVSILDHTTVVVPGIVADAGEHAAHRFLEFSNAPLSTRPG